MSTSLFKQTNKNLNVQFRKGSIEIFRFFLIFTVIWQHSLGNLQDPVMFPIGVVGFFFLSGFFQVNSEKSRFWKFLTTTIVYTIFGFLVYIILFYTGINSFNPWNFFTDGRFFKDDFLSWYFLYIMLFINLFAPYFNKWIKKSNKWTLLAIMICVWLCLIFIMRYYNQMFNFWDMFAYVNPFWIIQGSFVYILGGVINYHFSASFQKNKRYLIPIACLIILAYFLMNIFNTQITNFWIKNNLGFSLLSVRSDFSLIPLLFVISSVLCLNCINIKNRYCLKTTSWICKMTLPMYLFNGVIAELVNLFGYFNLKTNDAYYFFLIVFAILILVGVLLGYISDKIINKIYFSISNKFKRKT